MADQITYNDKQLGQANPLPEEKKYTFQNANMVKNVVNSNADAFKDATKTWVSVDGDNGTGEVGNFFSPFATPTAAAVAIRAAAPTNPMMVIQKGTYVAEDCLFADGIMSCEYGVTLQTGDNNAMFENIDGSYDGIDYQILGYPVIRKSGTKHVFNVAIPINNLKIFFDRFEDLMLSAFAARMIANNISGKINSCTNINFWCNYLNIEIRSAEFSVLVTAIDNAAIVPLHYLDITEFGTIITYDADSLTLKGKINVKIVERGDAPTHGDITFKGNSVFNLDLGTLITSSVNGVSLRNNLAEFNISGKITQIENDTFPCIKIFNNPLINFKGLTLVHSFNNQLIDSDLVNTINTTGLLTMLTTAEPKISPNITLNRISEPDQIPIAGQNMSINLANPHSPIFNSETVTSAGSIVRVWFTGDEVTTTEGTFYKSNASGKGIVAEAVQVINVNDNIKLFYPQDVLGSISTILETIHAGTYTSFLSAKVSLNGGEQRFTIEVYLTDADGLPFDSPDVTQPIGDLGVRILALLGSGKIDMQSGNETQVNLSGSIPNQVEVSIGSRVRYHVSGEKIGTAAGAVNLSLYYGSDYNSYLDAPIVSIGEAPIDGLIYGRKDGAWVVIP